MWAEPIGRRISLPFLVSLIVVFLVLDLTMLGLNFKITREVSEDALIINLSGRQRMLSQRISNTVFQINEQDLSSEESEHFIQLFLDVYALFSETLQAFDKGGLVSDAELNLVSIHKVTVEDAQPIIQHAKESINTLQPYISRIERGGMTPQLLSSLKKAIVENNDRLLALMNQLTVVIEKNSIRKIGILRMVQLVTFFLALLNFSFIIRLFMKMNKQSVQLVNTLQDLLQSTNAALLIFNAADKVVSCNRSAQRLFGYAQDTIMTLSKSDLFREENGLKLAISESGEKIAVELHQRNLFKNNTRYSVVTVVDISHHIEKETRDPLTGMLNRNAFNITLPYKGHQALALNQRFACFFIDFNDFKKINDTYGHKAGDRVLQHFSECLKTVLRDSDLAYRLGGDEFVILIELGDNNIPIVKVSEKLEKISVIPTILASGEILTVKFSQGIAVFPDDSSNVDELLNLADKRMYEQKLWYRRTKTDGQR